MEQRSIKNDWLSVKRDINKAISGLVRETSMRNEQRPRETKLSKTEGENLRRHYKNAEQARSNAYKWMVAIAKEIGVTVDENTVFIANMKDWERSKEKFKVAFNNTSRSMSDLGRGRIIFSNINQYKKYKKLLNSLDKDGAIKDINIAKASVIKDKIDDYIEKPRKSGYSGSVNTDLAIELTNSYEGKFEVQMMPKQYIEAYDHSHMLYDMIRILDEIPRHLKTREQLKVQIALTRGNRALFDEEAFKHGLMELREPNNKPSACVLKDTTKILDNIQHNIESLGGQNHAWRQKTVKAITYAKSSLLNLYVRDDSYEHHRQPG